MEKLEHAQAVAHGIGMTLGGESPEETTKAVFKVAYPHLDLDD